MTTHNNKMTLNLNELKRLAEDATPGKWIRLFGERTVYDRLEDGCRGNAIVRADVCWSSQDGCNLDFIAAANPATILALIERIQEAETRNALQQRALDTNDAALRLCEDVLADIAKRLGVSPSEEIPTVAARIFDALDRARMEGGEA